MVSSGRGREGRGRAAPYLTASGGRALSHSPKLNGYVERAHRTHVEEFYNFYDGELTMGPLNRALREWEAFYNEERPHQSLGWRTPMEYLAEQRLEEAS